MSARGGIGQMQAEALALGSRVRQHEVSGPTDYVVTVYGPGNKRIASLFIANSTQEEAETIAKKQISFRLSAAV